jgi:hypothetical protein
MANKAQQAYWGARYRPKSRARGWGSSSSGGAGRGCCRAVISRSGSGYAIARPHSANPADGASAAVRQPSVRHVVHAEGCCSCSCSAAAGSRPGQAVANRFWVASGGGCCTPKRVAVGATDGKEECGAVY